MFSLPALCLLHATKAQREGYELSRRGMHWDALDEDISVAGLYNCVPSNLLNNIKL
jgi:Protein of unknown function (DUF2442)